MPLHPEAQALLAANAEDGRDIKRLLACVKSRKKRLEAIVIEVFNELSAPIDGIVLDPGEVVVGYNACAETPIGVCCYSDRVVTLPGQRAHEKWRAEHADTPQEHRYPKLPEASTDACLFCGRNMND